MFTITADVNFHSEEIATVTVNGHNLSTDLIREIACHALCMEIGCGLEELEGRWHVEGITEEPSESIVEFESSEYNEDDGF